MAELTNSDEPDDTLLCLQCGYNLHTLPDDANCPECNLPVALSKKQARLRYSGSDYLAKIQTALMFLLFGTLIAAGFDFLQLTTRVRDVWVEVLCQLPTIAGLWWLTTPAPNTVDIRRANLLRKLVRLSTIAIVIYGTYLLMPWYVRRLLPRFVVVRLGLLLPLLNYCGSVVRMLYLKLLATRIPNAKLARFALQLALMFGAIASVSATVQFAYELTHAAWIFLMVRLHVLQWIPWALFVADALSLLLLNGISKHVHQLAEQARRSEARNKR